MLVLMENMRTLVANEPHTYRDVLVDALRIARPEIEVSTVEPDELEKALKNLRPHLVLCSQDSGAPPENPCTWVKLYPEGENRAEIYMPQKHVEVVGIRFGELLSIVDCTRLICRSG